MSNISSSNTENMILTRLIYQHPVTPKMDDVDIDREFRRYEARQGKDRDFIKSCTSLRKIQIKERLKNRIYIIMSYVSLILMDFIMYL